MKTVQKDIVTKYLAVYAEPEAKLGIRLHRHAEHVLVIPAQAEPISILDGYRQAFATVSKQGGRTLCIVVVNSTGTHNSLVQQRNDALVHGLRTRGTASPLHQKGETPCWYVETPEYDLVVLDRNRSGYQLPTGQGVGLARKIGCDFALSALHEGLNSSPLIHMTDCDVRLPSDYFNVTVPRSCAALTYRFTHKASGNRQVDSAHAQYEAYLRYYVLGLRHAGSTYAFHTIGSCIAVTPIAYAAVRGVPKRQAGEDFYLLNKLAKVGHIRTASSSPLTIQARTSQRVPFGTGQATNDIIRNDSTYKIYDPKIFDLLKAWCTALEAINDTSVHSASKTVQHRAVSALDVIDRPHLQAALIAIGAPEALTTAAAQSPRPAIRQKWLADWFDAFRTLKLVHALRTTGFPDIPWFQALRDASFCRSAITKKHVEDANTPDAFKICQRLALLEEEC